jgi:LacI family transcriptional regulator
LRDEATVHGDFRDTGGRAATEALLRRRLGLTAVLAANDLMAIGAHWCNAGRRGPDDVSLIGFNGIWFRLAVRPAVAAVVQPLALLAQTCLRMVVERIKAPALPPRREMLPATLEVRASCRDLTRERTSG